MTACWPCDLPTNEKLTTLPSTLPSTGASPKRPRYWPVSRVPSCLKVKTGLPVILLSERTWNSQVPLMSNGGAVCGPFCSCAQPGVDVHVPANAIATHRTRTVFNI